MKTYYLYLKDKSSYVLLKLDKDPDPDDLPNSETGYISLPSNGGQIIIKASEFVLLVPAE